MLNIQQFLIIFYFLKSKKIQYFLLVSRTSSQYISKSSDSYKLLLRVSSKAGK